jgi:S1-C subfamily serine protease
VKLPNKEGQGVLVPGGFILTAAHCIEWNTDGGMTLGDDCPEVVVTAKGDQFHASVYAVEPIADIAVLGAADDQTFYKDAEAFESFCEQTAAVPICTKSFKPASLAKEEESVVAYVLTHRGTWIEATVSEPGGGQARAWLRAEKKISGGTSGGPIVDDDGSLLGVVSWSSEDTFDGAFPRPHRALPLWIWRQIEAAEKRVKRRASPGKKHTR